jgi:predicted nucleotidyltransferase
LHKAFCKSGRLYYNCTKFFTFVLMNPVELHIDKISDLCSTHRVNKLYLFGSTLTDQFNQESDIDLIVDFSPMDLSLYAENYYNLKFSLQKLLGRQVDLLELKGIRNPVLKQQLDHTKKLIYGY